MITDPVENTKDRGQVVKGTSKNWDLNFVRSSKRILENKDYHAGNVGIRIVMNVTDMKKLMESNYDH